MENISVTGLPQFMTSHWSLVGAAEGDEVSQTRAREALEELCRAYWHPLYAFVCSRRISAVDALDSDAREDEGVRGIGCTML